MKTHWRIFVIVILACCSFSPSEVAAAGKPAPTYSNPVYAASMPDPSVIRYKGIYYAFGTTGSDRLPDGRIFTVLRSRDLVKWEKLGGALMPFIEDLKVQYWAPEVVEHKGEFYLYYSMGGIEPEKFELRVATSKTPEGPYLDSGFKLVDCETNRFTIDAFPFKDTDGTWYLFYARNFTNAEPRVALAGSRQARTFARLGAYPGTAIVVDKLVGMTRLAGDCKVVVRARYDWTLFEANRRMNVYNQTFDWHTIEGPCVVIHKRKYYCFYSGSNWQSDRYGVDYVIADAPMGPYQEQGDRPRVLAGVPGQVRGPGHHSIVPGPKNDGEYIVYHAWDREMKERQLCVDKLVWTPDGPRCQPTTTPQPLPR